MKLFKYSDSKDFTWPDRIYADSLDNSLLKWIDLLNDPNTKGQYNEELKSLVNQSKVPPFQKLRGSCNTFYLVFISEVGPRTIYVNEDEILPDFIADLEYLTTENGGRQGYAFSGYRPHVKFPFSQNMTSGEQVFWDRDKVYPGEKIRAQIRILDHVTFKHALSDDMTFEFCEGPRIIGLGKIVEVTNEELKKASR
ncbi:MAG TPA: hypothetical protein PKC10_05495 [Cyclobacteriaceae bacterium]|nr:hypothetical protein [Cyclobacteriaceae bacterium]